MDKDESFIGWIKQSNGVINLPLGFHADGLHAGFRRNSSRYDLGCLYSEVPAQAAALFTNNQFCGSHVVVTRGSLEQSHMMQGLICNSGQANTGTGRLGIEIAHKTQVLFQEKMQISDKNLVGVFSTGIIGILPKLELIEEGIERLAPSRLQTSGINFSRAILTTDKVTKTSCYTMQINGKTVTLAGNAKGSGMIHPNMATMLAFLTTDAAVDRESLQQLLKQCVDVSFHRISVDGETSTNDSIVLLANGMAGNETLTPQHPDWNIFAKALENLCLDLAHAIVRDGEGAHKFIEVEVFGALTEEEATIFARSVVSSNLFKAAVYGEDMNWGRINSALGAAAANHKLHLNFQRLDLIAGKNGEAIPLMLEGELQKYSEHDASCFLSQYHIYFAIHLHEGQASAKAWGCDLSYDYVHINAAKRS